MYTHAIYNYTHEYTCILIRNPLGYNKLSITAKPQLYNYTTAIIEPSRFKNTYFSPLACFTNEVNHIHL